MRFLIALLLALCVFAPFPAAALVPPAASESAASPAAPPAIDPEREAGTDQRIRERIAGIFSELPRLAGISVEVREGVVTLSGGVADLEDKSRAEAIAMRVAGVVTVENAIQRDVSVGQEIAGLGGVSAKIDELVRVFEKNCSNC